MLKVKQFTFNPFQENTYLLITETNECAIIDPGFHSKSEEAEFTGYIEKNKLRPTHLINTHCHIDHVFGIRFVQDKYGLPLRYHPKDRPMIENLSVLADLYGLKFDFPSDHVEWLTAKETIELAKEELRVIFTPGHSPGSICLFHEQSKILIAGDVLFRDSIGRTDLPLGDFDTLISSIKEQLFPLGDDVVVYPGHGPDTTIGREKVYNPFL